MKYLNYNCDLAVVPEKDASNSGHLKLLLEAVGLDQANRGLISIQGGIPTRLYLIHRLIY